MKLSLAHLSGLLFGAGALTPAAAKDTAYPLKTCLVSGNTLGSMGDPVTKAYNGQQIKLCCKPCIKKFDANPAKYLSKLK